MFKKYYIAIILRLKKKNILKWLRDLFVLTNEFLNFSRTKESFRFEKSNGSSDSNGRANFARIRVGSREISWPISSGALRKMLRIASYNTQCQLCSFRPAGCIPLSLSLSFSLSAVRLPVPLPLHAVCRWSTSCFPSLYPLSSSRSKLSQ